MAVQLSAVAPILLPPTITGPIFTKAAETSAVMSLARRVPLAVDAQTAVPVPMDVPTAGWVAEGVAKPVAAGGAGVKIMQGKKVALLVPLSEEVVRTNAAGLFAQLEQDLPTAIARAFDYAAIHGKDLKTGGAGPFTDYLASTTNTQVIGTSTAAQGGVYTDLWNGIRQVYNSPVPYEFSGFAADPRLKPELALSLDTQGRPLFVDNSFSANSGVNGSRSLVGYDVAFNPGVSGKYYRGGDAVQVVTVNGVPTGGTFTLTIGGLTTGAIAFNASGATVQAAIQALNTNAYGFGGSPAGTATVAGAGPYTVTFPNGAAPIYANGAALTGGTNPSVTVTQSPVADTGLRAIGGDFSQCAYGEGMSISIKLSTEASYTPDGGTTWVSAFQNNLVLLLAEAYYGFIVNDSNAFVAYTHAAGS